MKKTIALLLSLVMCLPLFGCSQQEPSVESSIQGTWTYESTVNGVNWHEELLFSGTDVIHTSHLGNPNDATISKGVYSIEGDKLLIYYEKTDYTNTMDISWDDDNLILSMYIDSGADRGTTRIFTKSETSPTSHPETDDVPVAEPVLEKFSIRNDVHFGDSMDEVASKEKGFDIDYESAGKRGYISAQATGGYTSTTEFEGIEDATLFYFFDANAQTLSQVYVMFAYQDNRSSMLSTHEGFLKLYFERYGVQLTDDQMQYLPIDTVAYEYATTHYEDTQLEKHSRWLLNDADGYVILDVASSLCFGDSYYTFIGLRHVTEEEIIAAGGDLTAILQE